MIRLIRWIGYLIGLIALLGMATVLVGCGGDVNGPTAPTKGSDPWHDVVNPDYHPPTPTPNPIPTPGSTPCANCDPPAIHNVILSVPFCGCGYVGIPVTLLVSTNEPGSFSWDFGEGNTTTSSTYTVVHTYTSTGIYRLHVTTATGYVAGADITIGVLKQ